MTSPWKRRFKEIATAAAVVALCVETVHGVEPVRIGWVYAMANAPVLIAQADGHFEAQGLEVTLESFTSGPLIRKGLNGESTLDMAYIGVPPIVHWVAKGAELVIVAKVNYGQASLLARRDAGIRTRRATGRPAPGRRAREVRHGRPAARLRAGRGRWPGPFGPGRDRDDAGRRNGSGARSRRFDAAFMWEPFVAQTLARRTARVVLNVNRVEPYYPWYVIAARREFVDAHPERVKSVLRAHRLAIKHLRSSPNAGNSVIAEAFELKRGDRARRQGVLARGDRQARQVAARLGVGSRRGRPGLHRAVDGLERFARVHQGTARHRIAARSGVRCAAYGANAADRIRICDGLQDKTAST